MHQLAQRIQQRAQEDLARVLSALQASGQAALADARHRQVEAVDARIVGFANACAAATFAEGVRGALKRDLLAHGNGVERSNSAARARSAALREAGDDAVHAGDTEKARRLFLEAARREFSDESRSVVRADDLLLESLRTGLFEADGRVAFCNAQVNAARDQLAQARLELEMIDSDESAARLLVAWLTVLDGHCPGGTRALELARIRIVIGASQACRRLLRLAEPQGFNALEVARLASAAAAEMSNALR